MSEQFVVHTFYLPAGNKKPVVHAYGPYTTRSKANAERRRMLRESDMRIEHERKQGAIINISTCRLIGEESATESGQST